MRVEFTAPRWQFDRYRPVVTQRPLAVDISAAPRSRDEKREETTLISRLNGPVSAYKEALEEGALNCGTTP